MLVRLGALCGIVGATFLSLAIFILTVAQYNFLIRLGWHPLYSPTFDWPSGLALGPYGRWMTLTFIVCGALLMVLSLGLRDWLLRCASSTASSFAVAIAAIGMSGLAFTTDPTLSTTTPTWHGRLHDSSFLLLSASLVISQILLAQAFLHQRRPRWMRFTLVICATVVIGFVLKGLLFYLMFLATSIWFVGLSMLMLKTNDP
jgi:hypothetical protein